MDKKENQPREKKGMPLAPVFLLGATVLLLIEMYFIVNLPRVYPVSYTHLTLPTTSRV